MNEHRMKLQTSPIAKNPVSKRVMIPSKEKKMPEIIGIQREYTGKIRILKIEKQNKTKYNEANSNNDRISIFFVTHVDLYPT